MTIEGIYTAGQVAKLFGVERITVGKWVDSGKLKGFRIPGGLTRRRRITRKSLIEFIEELNIPLELLNQEAILELGLDRQLVTDPVIDYVI